MAVLLVVEDDAEINSLMALTLRLEKHEVLQAYDGQTALQIARERLPDLILLDVMIPQLSGFEVAQELQKHNATTDIPIIFVTAKSDVEDLVFGLQMGVDYIRKPFAVPELLARVHAALRLQQRLQEMKTTFSAYRRGH